jgi:hypothetical protein
MEEAVRWRMFRRAVQYVKTRNAKTDPGELQRIVDDALRQVRAKRRATVKADRA